MVDASHDKEQQASTTIKKLKEEIINLTRLVEQGTGLSNGQEQSVKELLKMKEDLTKGKYFSCITYLKIIERDAQSTQIVQLRTEISELLETVHNQEGQKLDLEGEIHQLKELMAAKQDEIEKEQRRKDILERELKVTE